MTTDRPRIGFPLRLAAAAIDYAIIAAVSAAAGLLLGRAWGPAGTAAGEQADVLLGEPMLAAALGVVAGFGIVGTLYMAIEAWTGASPGKRVMGLTIGTEDGAPPPPAMRLARYLVKNCHLIAAALAAVSGMWLAGVVAPLATLVAVAGGALILTGDHRALHDLVARTAVFRTDRTT